MWSAEGYRRELDSPNSCLRMVSHIKEPSGDQPLRVVKDGIEENEVKNDRGRDTGAKEEPENLGLGCYWAILDEAHITLLGIDPRYQRRGLGQWLLLNLLTNACQRHLTRATLEVRPSNSRALALYQNLGFEALGTRRRYYPDGEDALIFWQNSLKTPSFQDQLRLRLIAAEERLNAQGWHIARKNHPVNRT